VASASLRISTLSLGIVILSLFSGRSAQAADDVSETVPQTEIEAKAYDLTTIRPSKSGRVYLFQKAEEGFPVDGKIILLREGDTPVMAFRVLKTYSATKKIAAKKLLPYEGFALLERGSKYRAYEKVGDKVAPVPPTAEDLKDLQELEGGNPESPPPASADASTPEIPPPPAEDLAVPPAADVAPPATPETPPAAEPPPITPPAEATSEEGEPRVRDLEMKDTENDEDEDDLGKFFPNFITVAVGLVFDGKVPGPNPKFGGGVLYSRNLDDTYAFEGGFYYFKSSGPAFTGGETITTTVIPLVGTIRYQKHYGELWTGYVYGGGMYNLIASNLGASKTQLAQMKTLNPALGVGIFLQTGPNWYLRLNLGLDTVSTGVVLRF
jgi:hypothetical protein